MQTSTTPNDVSMLITLTHWIKLHYFELIAAILGLISIYYQIKQKPVYWLISIIVVSMYIVVYIKARLYADMSLQFYYLVVSFYGWYQWVFGKSPARESRGIRVSKTGPKLALNLFVITVLLFFSMAWFLDHFTDSDVPYWDAFTTSLSFVATWMLARKKIENWLVWIVVDAVSVGIYIYKELYPTVVLFAVLTILAFKGYYEWKKEIIKYSE